MILVFYNGTGISYFSIKEKFLLTIRDRAFAIFAGKKYKKRRKWANDPLKKKSSILSYFPN